MTTKSFWNFVFGCTVADSVVVLLLFWANDAVLVPFMIFFAKLIQIMATISKVRSSAKMSDQPAANLWWLPFFLFQSLVVGYVCASILFIFFSGADDFAWGLVGLMGLVWRIPIYALISLGFCVPPMLAALFSPRRSGEKLDP